MLELIVGTDWIANRDEILRLTAEAVHSRRCGNVLMVPELISHDMERRLCAAAGDTASRYAEVLPFSRLADRVADSAGHGALACMDNGGRVVVMAAVTRQLHSKLKAYASVETRPEFLTGLVEAVDEFKRCCITPADLLNASKNTEGAFAQKLEELSLILETYDALCSRGKRDPGDRMSWVLEQLELSNYAQEHVFYIDGFPDFTRQHFAIVEHLIKHSPKVTVSLTCDKPGSTALAFEKAGNTAVALIRFAEEAGVPYSVRCMPSRPSALAPVREKLFQGDIVSKSVSPENLLLMRADSLLEDCQNVAARVMKLVRNGCRYRDIAIVSTDMVTCPQMLSFVFNRCKIPLYLSGTEEILQKSVITTVLAAMDASISGFDQKDVLRYLKSPLSPLDPKTVDQLENYVIIWGINGNKWLSPWENNPDGLTNEWPEHTVETLAALESARQSAVAPLEELRNGFSHARKLDDQVSALRRFFARIELSSKLSKLADSMDAAGDNRSAQIMNQLWEILLNALDQLQDSLGDTVWDQQTFMHLFTLLLSQYNVGTIPPVLDAVTVGPVGAMRCHQARHIIILGAQEGVFPGYSGSKGVFTDQERDALRAMGVGLTGGGAEGLQAEFAEIYGVFNAAGSTVMVSCGAGQPSYVYSRLLAMVGKEAEPDVYICPDELDISSRIIASGDSDAAVRLGVGDAFRKLVEKTGYQLGAISNERIEKLYGHTLNLSASQIDKQAVCRFAYFMEYGLRAKERKEITVNHAEYGTYVHTVLELTAKEVMNKGGFDHVSLDETLEIAHRYSDAYAKERYGALDSKRLEYLFNRNLQELDFILAELWRELSVSKFKPVQFELGFGHKDETEAVAISGKSMKGLLRGYVDRVDTWQDEGRAYFRVVDYKTGGKDFDYCDVFNGIGLQMLLYMFALEDNGTEILGGDYLSAGVQYLSGKFELKSATSSETAANAERLHKDSLKRKGLVLADVDVLNAMQPEGAPERLCGGLNKDGEMVGDVADREQLKLLRSYVFRVLSNLVDEIASGKVDANPYIRGSQHDVCSWCAYRSICHASYVKDYRLYQSTSADRFWNDIRKEMDTDG